MKQNLITLTEETWGKRNKLVILYLKINEKSFDDEDLSIL